MTAKADCRNLIIFLMCLLSVVKIRAQCGTPSSGDNRVLTPESQKLTYPDGDTVTFQCSVGYKPENPKASKTITCSGNKWDYSTLELQCKKKTCRPLPDFSNGRYTYSSVGDEGILFGAIATAQCNEGYILLRYTARRCLDSGWDGREPVCEAVKCRPPVDIPNGHPEDTLLEEYEYGQAVTYVCNTGYTRFGDSTISCSNNGTFQPSPPECIKVSCDPPSVPNGKKTQGTPPYRYRSSIEIACDPAFKMEGSPSLVCDRNGWNPSPPNCTEVICDSSSVPNGKIIDGTPPYKYKSTIKFACDSGFKMEGSDSVVCETNGWNPPPPKCTEVICDAPSVVNGKNIHGTPPYTYKSTIQFACDPDFKMEGSGSLVCETDGWNPPPPKCTGKHELNHTVKIVAGVCGTLVILGIGAIVYFVKKRSSTRGYSGNVAKNEEGAL
ncbi:hypothetical protein AOLI_G00157070 [Acnodon oligacanthus]